MPKCRVLVVSQYFWPESFRINDLVLGLKEKGHEVTVLTAKPNYPQGRFFKGYSFFGQGTEDFNGIEVIRVPFVPRYSGRSKNLIINYLSFLISACLIGLYRCRGRKFDVIFSYLPSPLTSALPAILLKKVKGARLHLWVQDLWPESISATGAIQSPKVLSWVGRIVRYIYNRADMILVSSKSFETSVRKYLTNSKTEIQYFPNSVEQLYKPEDRDPEFKARYGLPDGFTLMFAGNVGYAQDFPNILATAELLKGRKDIHFVIVGEGRHFQWVKDQVKQRGLQDTVHLMGSHAVELMPRFFAHADVMLVTLKNEPVFMLTVPAKIQSYLACGKPIISALDGEGGRLIEEAGAGIAVPAGDPPAFAEAIVRMMQCEGSERKLMSERALEYHNQNFRRDLLVSKLEAWFQGQSRA